MASHSSHISFGASPKFHPNDASSIAGLVRFARLHRPVSWSHDFFAWVVGPQHTSSFLKFIKPSLVRRTSVRVFGLKIVYKPFFSAAVWQNRLIKRDMIPRSASTNPLCFRQTLLPLIITADFSAFSICSST